MSIFLRILKPILTVGAISVALAAPIFAQDQDRLAELFERLQVAEDGAWEQIEEQIYEEWSRSGSASMDLLLRRGRDALEAGDTKRAVEHFSALIDHAPDFAEAWNARAMSHFRAERYGLAVADIARALELNPKHFGALGGLGQIMEQLGYEHEALEAYRASAALHPHRPDLNAAIERLDAEFGGTKL